MAKKRQAKKPTAQTKKAATPDRRQESTVRGTAKKQTSHAKEQSTVPKKEAAPQPLVPKYRSFRLSRRLKNPGKPVPSARKLLAASLRLLWQNKKVLGGIALLFGIVQLALVQGLISMDITELHDSLKDYFYDGWAGWASMTALLGYVVTTNGQASTTDAAIYQSILLAVFGLAFIWALRQAYAGQNMRLRDAFYRGMYPLVPMLLVLLVLVVQLLPALIGAWLYQTVVSAGIASSVVEQLIWALVFGLLAVLSLYMVLSSIFALLIAALPDMTPMRALRSARQLVLHRRLVVLARVVVLLLLVVLVMLVVLLPVVIFVPILAPWLFYVLGLAATALILAYMYSLYRELLA